MSGNIDKLQDVPDEGFALIVDLNAFTKTVSAAAMSYDAAYVATYVRDSLMGSVLAIEKANGCIVGLMGDAILGIVADPEDAISACIAILTDCKKQREYFRDAQEAESAWLPWAPGGPELKIGVEYGSFAAAQVHTKFLGEQTVFIGEAINYAARILIAGSGTRCLVGPRAADRGFNRMDLAGPHTAKGKPGEPPYEFYYFLQDEDWEPE